MTNFGLGHLAAAAAAADVTVKCISCATKSGSGSGVSLRVTGGARGEGVCEGAAVSPNKRATRGEGVGMVTPV